MKLISLLCLKGMYPTQFQQK